MTKMEMFDLPELTEKYGSWVRVQVEFYDYLFKIGMNLCPTHWKEMSLREAVDQFSDGEDFY